MGWIGAIARRVVQFWGGWLLLLSFCCCGGDGPSDFSHLWRMIRTALFLSTAWLVLTEWRAATAAILAFGEDLREAGKAAPRPWSRLVAWSVVALVFGGLGGWSLWFLIFSPVVHEVASDSVLAALIVAGFLALVWTLATVSTALLAMSGLGLFRLRWAARGVPPRPGKARTRTLPITVAAWSGAAFFVALGFPSPELIGGLLEILIILGTPPEGHDGRGAYARGSTYAAGTPVTSSSTVDLLVTVQPGRSSADVEMVSSTGAIAQRAFPGITSYEDTMMASTYIVTVPADEAVGFMVFAALDSDVQLIELDAAVTADPVSDGGACQAGYTFLPVNDPYASAQSALQEVGGATALTELASRRPQRPGVIAIVDTGVEGRHRDINDVMLPYGVSDDRNGHGTAVAGVAAAITDNNLGIASLNEDGAYLRIRSYPALAGPRPDADDVARAIWEAADDDVDVINLSFSGQGAAPTVVVRAIDHAIASGSVVVASAGNGSGDAGDHWPANIDGVLVVGATELGAPASFSKTTYGVSHRVWAPGAGVCTLATDGTYTRKTGTSMAAPMVSSTIAAMRALCPGLSASDARTILELAGQPVGYGLGNAAQADVALAALFLVHPECEQVTRNSYEWAFPAEPATGTWGSEWPRHDDYYYDND